RAGRSGTSSFTGPLPLVSGLGLSRNDTSSATTCSLERRSPASLVHSLRRRRPVTDTWRPFARYSPHTPARASKVTTSTKSAPSSLLPKRGTARRKVADSCRSPARISGSAVRRPIRHITWNWLVMSGVLVGGRGVGAGDRVGPPAPVRRLEGTDVVLVVVVVVDVGGGFTGLAAELNPADDGVLGAAGAVFGGPFSVDEASGDGNRASLRQVLGAGLGLGAEGGDVDEERGLTFLVVDGQAHVADLAALIEGTQDWIGGEVADEGDRVDGGCGGAHGRFSLWDPVVDRAGNAGPVAGRGTEPLGEGKEAQRP